MASVTVVGVWIGNLIYWILTLETANNYDSLAEPHILNISVTTAHIKSSSVFTSHCLVAAFNS
jgi:hypothetical protein